MDGKQSLKPKTGYKVVKDEVNSEAIATLLSEFAKEAEWKYFDKEHVKKVVEHYTDHPDGIILTLEYDDLPVGVICGIVQQHMYDPTSVVSVEMAWYVKPEHRKTLYNIKLVKEYEKISKELGATSVFMTLRASMKPVQHIYERMGYIHEESSFSKEI